MLLFPSWIAVVVVGVLLMILPASAWLSPPSVKLRGVYVAQRSFLWHTTIDYPDDDDWSVTDNWNRLSTENEEINTNHLLNADQTTLAALRMQNFGMNPAAPEQSPEDQWLNHVIEHIVTDEGADEEPALHAESFVDDIGREIALLVRCNENPHDLLMEGGRMVEELTEEQRNDVRQLVEYDDDDDDGEKTAGAAVWKATTFLREAARSMFQKHAPKKPGYVRVNGDHDDGSMAATATAPTAAAVMNAVSVASWMSQSLRETVGPYDKRVAQALARYGSGGYLSEPELLKLYVTTITGEEQEGSSTAQQLEKYRAPEIKAVWRDIRNHGLVTPAEFAQSIKVAELQSRYGRVGVEDDDDDDDDVYSPMNMLDECEILEDHMVYEVSMTTDRQGKSSNERVDLVRGVPIWMNDGDYGT
jgi:hypothetical protein